MNVLEEAVLEVLFAFHILMKILKSLLIIFICSKPIYKDHSELGFEVKVSSDQSFQYASKSEINALLQH